MQFKSRNLRDGFQKSNIADGCIITVFAIFFQFSDRLRMDRLRDVTQTIFLSRNIRFTYDNIRFFTSLYTDNVYQFNPYFELPLFFLRDFLRMSTRDEKNVLSRNWVRSPGNHNTMADVGSY